MMAYELIAKLLDCKSSSEVVLCKSNDFSNAYYDINYVECEKDKVKIYMEEER